MFFSIIYFEYINFFVVSYLLCLSIRHKKLQFIPEIWLIPQFFVLLQRQTRNETNKTNDEDNVFRNNS